MNMQAVRVSLVLIFALSQQCVLAVDEPNELYTQALTLENTGNLSQAQTIYSQILSEYPESPSARPDRAAFRVKLMECKLALQNGDTALARSYIDQIKTLGGTASQTASRLYNTADAFEAAKLYDDAMALYQETIARDPQGKYASSNYAGFKILLTQCKRSLREYDTASARAMAEKIKKLQLSAEKGASQLYAAANEFAQAQYFDKMLSNDAIVLYQQLISQYPNSIYAGTDYAGWRLKLAQCKLALKKGNLTSARESADQIKAMAGSAAQKAERMYNMGFAFDEVHALNDAAGLYQQAISQCSSDPGMVSKNTFQIRCIEKEIALASPNMTAEAVNSTMTKFIGGFDGGWSASAAAHGIGKYLYESGAKLKSDDPNSLLLMQKAAAVYGYWLSHQPQNDKWLNDMRRGWMFYIHGLCLNRLGEYANAAEAFKNAYQANPKHQYADYLLFAHGRCYEKLLEKKLVAKTDAKAVITAQYSQLIAAYPQSMYRPIVESWLRNNNN